jgi:hypothetical protein
MAIKKIKKWHEIYPQGTKEGDDDQKIFISLERNPNYKSRSVASICKDTGLSEDRVIDFLDKYSKLGQVFQNPNNENYWFYWELLPDEFIYLISENPVSIADMDKNNRIKSKLNKN